ncbi:MAG: hypothetical protein H0T73_17285 [Ardenticatenales bacterium]|nr:hypothetical protein [Ardenticatenales bacterium]
MSGQESPSPIQEQESVHERVLETPSQPFYPLLVLLFSLFAIGPTLGSGYWWGAHDARHTVYFLFEFDQAIRDGVLWPRWAPDFAFGYGYPFFNVYAPFSTYVSEALHLLGLDLVSAVKLSFALSLLLSGLAMYGFARRLFGENGGLLAAVAYVYLPYHLADIYLRAAMAESWAFVFLPLVFWGFYECATQPRAKAIALTALAYALFFLSHNGLAVQVTFVLMAWILFWLLLPLRLQGRFFWQSREALLLRARHTAAAAGAALLGVGVGAIFILPWLLETRFVNQEQWFTDYFSFTHHFVEPWQLLSPYWGSGISVAGPEDTFPFQLGLVPLLLAAAAWVLRVSETQARQARLFFTGMLIYFIFLMVEASRFLWESPLGGILAPMQFPWRFLALAGFALAVLAAVVGRRLSRGNTLLLAALIVVASQPYAQADIIAPAEGPVSHSGLMRFQQSAGEMTGQSSCVALEDIPTWSPLADVWVGGGEVNSRFAYGDLPEGGGAGKPVSRSFQEITEIRLEAPATVRWLITYYPGWHAYRLPLDGNQPLEELAITPAEKSCHLTVQAPPGHYRLLVRFEDTPVRVIGKSLSIISLLLVMGLIFGQNSRFKRSK